MYKTVEYLLQVQFQSQTSLYVCIQVIWVLVYETYILIYLAHHSQNNNAIPVETYLNKRKLCLWKFKVITSLLN